MKFDNLKATVKEARRIELPLGSTVVGFMVTHFDVRSVEYNRIKAKLSRPFRKLIDFDALPADKDRGIAIDAFVQSSLVGWDGITSEGVSVPFTPEAAHDLFVQSPSLFYSLIAEAAEDDNFKPSDADVAN